MESSTLVIHLSRLVTRAGTLSAQETVNSRDSKCLSPGARSDGAASVSRSGQTGLKEGANPTIALSCQNAGEVCGGAVRP